MPGLFRDNDLHRITLYNPHPKPLDLSEWLLVTREYSFQFPEKTLIAPKSYLTLAKKQGDISLDRHPNFLIRFPDPRQAGQYAILLNKLGQPQIGLYLAPLAQVLFLPDSGVHISHQKPPVPYQIPPETAPLWTYVPWDPDPITGVVQIQGRWRYTVSDIEKEKRLYAPLAFSPLYIEAESLGLGLSWQVEVREPCEVFYLERSEIGSPWQEIHAFPCPPLGHHPFHYTDTTVKPYTVYSYRLRYRAEPSLTSQPAGAQWQRPTPSFRLSVQPGLARLYVAQGQRVKVKLLNARFEEVFRLYDGYLNGGIENIFAWDTTQLQGGRWVVVWTSKGRQWRLIPAHAAATDADESAPHSTKALPR